MKIEYANIVTAFDENTIGSKIIDSKVFLEILERAIEYTAFENQKVPGQALIPLTAWTSATKMATQCVSSGVGKRTDNIDDYIIREHRGHIGMYLKRHLAALFDELDVVVYTKDAYLKDPDVNEEEINRVKDATHILVAVLASSGPRSPLSPGRFVKNLAGGNRNMDDVTVEHLKDTARGIAKYYDVWCTVAD